MLRKIMAVITFTAILSGPALSADIIAGNWKTQSGETALISGGGSYSIVLQTGKHAGKNIGSMTGSNGKYAGTITDPADNKKYKGSARISGTVMKMKGCVLSVLCKTQTWNKL